MKYFDYKALYLALVKNVMLKMVLLEKKATRSLFFVDNSVEPDKCRCEDAIRSDRRLGV